jgi:hypothetical protein
LCEGPSPFLDLWTSDSSSPANRLQALTSTNDSYKYLRDPTIDGVVETDAIKFVQTNREKVTMSSKEDQESKEPGYDEDKDQLDEDQEEDTGELNEETNNNVFYM